MEVQTRTRLIHLQVEGCRLDGVLHIASQPRETVGEGVGDAEVRQLCSGRFAKVAQDTLRKCRHKPTKFDELVLHRPAAFARDRLQFVKDDHGIHRVKREQVVLRVQDANIPRRESFDREIAQVESHNHFGL